MAQTTPSSLPADGAKQPAQNIHVLNAPEVEKRSWQAQRRRRRAKVLSFAFFVLLPSLLVGLYYGVLASDRYAVETRFAIRAPGGSVGSDLLGIMTGFSAASTTITDSYMVVDFLESRDLVDRLSERLDLAEIYDRPDADFLMRLDGSSRREDLTRYFARMSSIYFDNSSQILTYEVQAFSPEDALRVSETVIAILEEVINEVSERARADTMRSAEREVARIETQLREHRRAMTAFRQAEQDIDPAASAGAQIRLVGELEGQLAALRTRLSAISGSLSDDAPSVRVLRRQIAALESQVERQRARLGGGPSAESDGDPQALPNETRLTMRLEAFEDLAVDLEFLQQAYIAALAARETARIEADRSQRYLAVFVRPLLPQKATYPHRIQNSLIFAGFAILLWGIGVMIVYIIREHNS